MFRRDFFLTWLSEIHQNEERWRKMVIKFVTLYYAQMFLWLHSLFGNLKYAPLSFDKKWDDMGQQQSRRDKGAGENAAGSNFQRRDHTTSQNPLLQNPQSIANEVTQNPRPSGSVSNLHDLSEIGDV